ncbi:MAG: hypothetical protein BWK79_01195 [Beggiatoa sp. IS2]|nr:MAG: hypothetical protein BWK79_01195 [Beggiatoa sp. IS2]
MPATLTYAQERIVALSPAINEIIFAVGAGDQIVANTFYADYPPAAKNIYKVGGYFRPDLEKILLVRPTLVIMHPHDPLMVKRLTDMGLRVVTASMETLADIVQAVETIGAAVGKPAAGQQLAAEMRAKIAKVRATDTKLKILVVFGMDNDMGKGIFIAGQNLYFDSIIRLVGAHNAYQSAVGGQPVLTIEGILALQPDVVIILAPNRQEQSLSVADLQRPWQSLAIPAATNQRIHVIDADYCAIPSHRVMYLLDDFQKIVQSAQ